MSEQELTDRAILAVYERHGHSAAQLAAAVLRLEQERDRAMERMGALQAIGDADGPITRQMIVATLLIPRNTGDLDAYVGAVQALLRVALQGATARAEQAGANAAALHAVLQWRQGCENCGGRGSYWVDVGGEAEAEVCDCWIRADQILREESPGAALLAELRAARTLAEALREHPGCLVDDERLGAALTAYDAARATIEGAGQ